MKALPKNPILIIAWSVCLLALLTVCKALADSPKTKHLDSKYIITSYASTEKGVRGPIGWHFYWEDGYLGVDGPRENIRFRINGQVITDAGNIDADDELQAAFPDLDGSNAIFRKLNLSINGNFFDTVDFKVGIDFANVRDIQDI